MTNLAQSLTALVGNQLFAGGFLLMISGAAMAACRKIPHEIWNKLLNLFTVSVTVNNTTQCYNYLRKWMDATKYGGNTRRVEVTVVPNGGSDDSNAPPTISKVSHTESNIPKFLFTPADGVHFFIHKGRLLWLTASSEKSMSSGANTPQLHRTLTLRYWGRSQNFIRSVMDEAAKIYLTPADDKITISFNGGDYWRDPFKAAPRSMESLILPDGILESLIEDVGSFLSNRAWYSGIGIPYRRGYLFEGIPGSGKSTTVAVIASHFRIPLYVLQPNSAFSDGYLTRLLSDLPPRCVLLCEDIDAAFKKRKETDDSTQVGGQPAVTFSGFLNAIDGIAASEGRLLFLTSNYVDKLDSALIRPGRIDMRVNFTHATQSQIVRMHHRFFPNSTPQEAEQWAAQYIDTPMGMSTVQNILLGESNCAARIVAQISA